MVRSISERFEALDQISKKEIARRQIRGAIYLHMTGGDPIAVYTLLAPASQILRDINKGNQGTLSNALSSAISEVGGSPSLLWKEFNKNAAKFKHSRDIKEVVSIAQIIKIIPMEINFCICEWMLMPENRNTLEDKNLANVDPIMAVFARHYYKIGIYNNKSNCLHRIFGCIGVRYEVARINFLEKLHKLLLDWAKSRCLPNCDR